jgi:penicillin G amidase
MKKILLAILILIILLLCAGFIYMRAEFKASIPQREGTVVVDAINMPLNIVFDKKGIPQIWANSSEDLWFAMGWLHAADRLFQMDLTRRVARGRLSEFFGSAVLDIDRLQRKIGHSHLAHTSQNDLDSRTKNLLTYYVAGINKWIEHQETLPFEYVLLGTEFEEWTIEDCLAVLSFQTWYSDMIQNNSDLFIQMAGLSDPDSVKSLLNDRSGWVPATVPNDKIWYSFRDAMIQDLFANGLASFTMSNASNSWAISPSKSASGSAILASDPHLDLSRLPQFWYIIGLHCQPENINVVGITAPGIPMIAFGHNGQIAWAFTAAGVNITDQYIERINPEDSTEYLTPAGWAKFSLRPEVIMSRDEAMPETLIVKSTRHGPVLSENDSLGEAYAFRWAGYDVSLSEAANNSYKMTIVNNFQDFRKIVTGLGALNANWMYADAAGNIGYQLGTPIPVRINNHNILRLPGWNDENEWQGYQPLDKTPHAYNPKRGWLATSNNLPADETLDYTLAGNFSGDRILKIEKLLNRDKRFSVDDMKNFQNDFHSEFILRWREPMAEVLQQLGKMELADAIGQWDGHMNPDSKESSLTELWLKKLKDLTFRDELGDVTDRMHLRVMFRDRTLYQMYMRDSKYWFDDKTTRDHIETREEIAQRAMQEVISELEDKSWGELQQLTMSHPMSAIPILSQLLGLEKGPFPRGGNPGTLNASTSIPDGKDVFKVLGGPSWRFVIDFANVDQASMVIPAGQSGNPMDDHFFDFYDMWQKGEYWITPFSRNTVMSNSQSVLELRPASVN